MAIAGAPPCSPFIGHVPLHLGKSSSSSPHFTHNPVCFFQVKALFWGLRRSADKVLSLGKFTLSPLHSLEDRGSCEKISVSVVSSISAEEWKHRYAISIKRHSCRIQYQRYGQKSAIYATGTPSIRSGGGAKRTVLITGVSRGLGKALALELAKRGHYIIGCARSQDKLDAVQTELASATSSPSENKHLLLNVDVSLDSSVEEFARAVMEKKGVPDIIVNSAGTINRNNKLWEVSAEEFDSVIDTNLKGTANVLRHFIPLMLEKKQGVIVNMSSGWGRSGAAQVAPYCASKWAIEGLTASVAKELPPGMAAVALNPGVIYTDMLQSCFGNSASMYQTPESWAPKAADMILNLTMADNGASLSV